MRRKLIAMSKLPWNRNSAAFFALRFQITVEASDMSSLYKKKIRKFENRDNDWQRYGTHYIATESATSWIRKYLSCLSNKRSKFDYLPFRISTLRILSGKLFHFNSNKAYETCIFISFSLFLSFLSQVRYFLSEWSFLHIFTELTIFNANFFPNGLLEEGKDTLSIICHCFLRSDNQMKYNQI